LHPIAFGIEGFVEHGSEGWVVFDEQDAFLKRLGHWLLSVV
jgi:hypothetical protein